MHTPPVTKAVEREQGFQSPTELRCSGSLQEGSESHKRTEHKILLPSSLCLPFKLSSQDASRWDELNINPSLNILALGNDTEYLETEIAAKIKADNNKVISSGQTQVYEEVFLIREPERRYLST